uniref:Uncharacterized protein AlNc14C202G8726 n=1 Tax=Albugo laibachii Nc14 TaxID=890382 RepID=F0WQR6_9STRA|nr:conserved hypothetical protein [Albugo laibachii Nc14]CCA25336.1 conserved hypothetical protein [Albugo laibachii Nc14]|eukprot:CCA25336.1 conserved hypothetical protein [Albugo laibachii Nc14]
MSLEVLGASLATFSSIVSNVGVNIQKYSHSQETNRTIKNQRPYFRRPVWWIGLLLVIVGSLGDFTAFGFATQSLVAAVGGGTTLLTNVFTAHYLNKELLHSTDLIGIIFVIFGVVIIAILAEPDQEYSLPALEKRFARTEFVVYVVIVVVSTVCILATIKGSVPHRLKNQIYASKRRQKQLIKHLILRLNCMEQRLCDLEVVHNQSAQSNRPFEQQSNESFGRTEPVTDYNDQDELISAARVPYYYAICSGIVGAISVLLAKCSALMIRLTIKGENQFQYCLTYVFMGGMLICIIIQTHFLNIATSLGDIMTVFPIFQACWIIFSVIGGAIFYKSSSDIRIEEYIWYPAALLSIVIGVSFLVQHRSNTARYDHSNSEGEDISFLTDSFKSPLLTQKFGK